jgi:RecA-family ATPase
MPRTYLDETDEYPTPDPAPKGEFKFLVREDLLNQPPPQYLIEHLIAKRNFIVLYGAPGIAKSFLALHWHLCIATGIDCFGRRVRRGPSLYISAEGEEGFQERVRAWERAYPEAEDLLGDYYINEPVELLKTDKVEALIEQLEAMVHPPVFIIFDTLARCMVGGDENSARDVGLAVAAIDKIRKSVGATALVLHHSGKKAASERGSSALRGGADSMFRLFKAEGILTLANTKQKHGRKQKDLELSLRVIELGEIDDSVVIDCDVIANFTENEQKILTLLHQHRHGLAFSEIEAKTKLKPSPISRALKTLVEAVFITRPKAQRGGLYRITDLAARTLERPQPPVAE